MAWFRRKAAGGRHALGAAVTSIPSGPPTAPVVAVGVPAGTPAAVAEPDLASSIAELIATGEAWRSEAEILFQLRTPGVAPAVAQPVAAPVPAPVAPRVQLGFRDGTVHALEPDSEQALALETLAESLTRRD